MRKTFTTLALLALASGCGWSVSGARDAYAQKWCAYEVRCGNIGAGHTLTTTDECLVKYKADAQTLWPTATCEGHIDSTNLDGCLNAIDSLRCDNLADQFQVLSRCMPGEVCK